MPKTIDRLSQQLAAAIGEANDMLAPLSRLLPEPDGAGPSTGTIGRSAPESSEPWNGPVADAYWNLWFGPGQLIGMLRYALGLSRIADHALPRGGEALTVVYKLASGAPDDSVRYVIKKLERWVAMAQRIPAIDEAEPWSPVPVVPGADPPSCPYCRTFGLRMQRRRGEVRCFFPNCTDADGNRTGARMEPGRMTGEARLVFRDGTTLHFRERHEAKETTDA